MHKILRKKEDDRMINGFPIPFPPTNNNFFFQEELNEIRKKIKELENKIQKIEAEKNNDYLKNDDNYYMI